MIQSQGYCKLPEINTNAGRQEEKGDTLTRSLRLIIHFVYIPSNDETKRFNKPLRFY